MIFVYDCTSEETFNSMRHWIRNFESHTQGRTEIQKILVGNKSDMVDEKIVDS